MSEEKQEAVAAGPASSKAGKLVPILTIVNLFATLGIVAMLAISFQKSKNHVGVDDIDSGGAEHGADSAVAHGDAAPAQGAAAGEHGGEADTHGEKKTSVNYGKMVALDQFQVNLSTPGTATPKYVRVNISLEIPNSDIESEAVAKMPQIRNAIIDLFNAKTSRELSTADGREYLKEEIRNAINGFMVQGKIKGVFFTYFSLGG